MKKQTPDTLPLVRCAVYTRKSTEDGLQQEFNSLDAQREAAEAYVKSQQHEGWRCLPERYDDGGFTGGNTDRPGLRRLLADIEAGKVDAVIVYKVDRLSRSLLDFARLMQLFEDKRVSFVSVTQQFNTATSMGRLVLNVLLSFAQFEREIIAERTRDKMAATRRKGKWAGGRPVLGYDLDRRCSKLVVNPEEAERVRAIFDLYLEHKALLPVVKELDRRGWVTKRRTAKDGTASGGDPFTKTSLHRLLVNVIYTGKVKYKDELYDGEHAAIVDPVVFDRVQATLAGNGVNGGPPAANRFGAFLKGKLTCVPCGCRMTPAHSTKGSKRYRYYVCTTAQKKGWEACPSKSIPAGQVEAFVVEQLRCIGRDPQMLAEVLAKAHEQEDARTADLATEQRVLETDLAAWQREIHALTGKLKPGEDNGPGIARLADLHDRIGQLDGRLARVKEQLRSATDRLLDEEQAAVALGLFDPVWETLTPAEQARVVDLLVEQVGYDGTSGTVRISFHDAGIRTLADALNRQNSEEKETVQWQRA